MFLVASGWLGVLGVELCDLDLVGQAHLCEQPDAVVVDVELVPGEAVARADRVSVVVVVPALAAGDQGDPPAVTRVVTRLEAACAVEVRGRVDEPGGMQADDDAEESSPDQHGDCAIEGMSRGERGADANLGEAGRA